MPSPARYFTRGAGNYFIFCFSLYLLQLSLPSPNTGVLLKLPIFRKTLACHDRRYWGFDCINVSPCIPELVYVCHPLKSNPDMGAAVFCYLPMQWNLINLGSVRNSWLRSVIYENSLSWYVANPQGLGWNIPALLIQLKLYSITSILFNPFLSGRSWRFFRIRRAAG